MSEIATFEPCTKTDAYPDEMVALILFNATMVMVSSIKDLGYRHEAKRQLNEWFNSGTRFWKEIKRNCPIPEAMDTYEELALFIKEVSKIALEKTDYNKFLKQIKELES